MMKKIFALLLSVIVAGVANASVTESGWYGYGGSGPVALVDGVYWCYQECDGGVRILGFDDGDDCSYAYVPGAYKKQNGYLVCVSGTVTIPSTINNKTVVEIGSCAFYGCTGVTSISIPSSVLRITGGAFEGCLALTQVSGGLNVQEVNGAAFNGCSKLITDGKLIWRNFFVTGADCVGDVVIPDGVTTICSSAFSKNSGSRVLSITIPQTVTSVGSSAFASEIDITNFVRRTNWTPERIHACVQGAVYNHPEVFYFTRTINLGQWRRRDGELVKIVWYCRKVGDGIPV